MSVCCCSLAGTVACDHCRNRSMTFEYSAGTTYSSEDFDFPKKKQTNADRIRAMTDDEEMAKFFDLEALLCPWCDMSCGDVEEIPCRKCILKWLKQEADT